MNNVLRSVERLEKFLQENYLAEDDSTLEDVGGKLTMGDLRRLSFATQEYVLQVREGEKLKAVK
jgi:hypothetical protein